MSAAIRWTLLGACVALGVFLPPRAEADSADSADYNARLFDSSTYVQHGPGPAYSGAYSSYGGNATGIEERFSPQYGGVPGYGRFGTGSAFGSGPLREAGTGRSGGYRLPARSPHAPRVGQSSP
jgi:hypothetical protein